MAIAKYASVSTPSNEKGGVGNWPLSCLDCNPDRSVGAAAEQPQGGGRLSLNRIRRHSRRARNSADFPNNTHPHVTGVSTSGTGLRTKSSTDGSDIELDPPGASATLRSAGPEESLKISTITDSGMSGPSRSVRTTCTFETFPHGDASRSIDGPSIFQGDKPTQPPLDPEPREQLATIATSKRAINDRALLIG